MDIKRALGRDLLFGPITEKHNAIAPNADVFDARSRSGSVHNLSAFEQQVETFRRKCGVSAASQDKASARNDYGEKCCEQRKFAHRFFPDT
jgi:hypothetical protein